MRRKSDRLYQRGHDRWYADLRDLGGGRKALRPPGDTRATTSWDVAATLLGKRIKELDETRYTREMRGLRRTAPYAEVARDWLAHMRTTETRERTIARYELAIRHLFTVLDPTTRMDSLTVADARAAFAQVRTIKSRYGHPLENSSLHQVLTAVQQMHDFAADEGVVSGINPWRQLRKRERPKPKPTGTDFLEVPDAAALIEAADLVPTRHIALRALVATLLLTGGRRSEVLGLEVGDIDFDRCLVTFRENRWRRLKRGHQREVPLFPQLARELLTYIKTTGRIGGLLFPGRDRQGTQVMLSGSKLCAQIARAAGHAGIVGKRVTPQVLRVTYCAARLQSLDNGEPCAQYTVQRELGHASGAMIQRVYGRLGRFRRRGAGVEYVRNVAAVASAI